MGFALVSCATGTLSLGMRCIEQVCNQADRLFSFTPVGERMAALLQALDLPWLITWLALHTAASFAVWICGIHKKGMHRNHLGSMKTFGPSPYDAHKSLAQLALFHSPQSS